MYFKLCFIFAIGLVGGCKHGHSRGHRESRKLSCQDAQDGEAPYQVSLRTLPGSHFCGGAIIGKRWIITAAQCTIGHTNLTMLVVVGTTCLSKGGDTYQVAKIIIHEKYNNKLITNDISLVKVTENIAMSKLVQPIQLPAKDAKESDKLILTGWGSISYSEALPDRLQLVYLSIYAREECQKIFSKKQASVADSQICTYTRGRSSCFADSGGPLVEHDRAKLIGIVSWGKPCTNGFPYVHSSIASFIDWISKNVKEMSDEQNENIKHSKDIF